MRKLFNRVAFVLRWRQRQRELEEELEAHRALAQEHLERDGLAPGEAAAASRRIMGNATLSREDARAVWIAPSLESLWQDAAYAIRTFARQPGFAVVAIGALAAAIGLNTSVFTVFNALALVEWPVRDPGRVVRVINLSPRDLRARAAGGPGGFSLDEVKYFSDHASTFSGFVVTRVGGGDKTIGEEDAPASWVSGNYFAVLGIEMARGRGFVQEEDRSESPSAVAVLSHGYWHRRFGGDESIVGRQIHLEDVPFTVVGITPRSFTGTLPNPVDIWMPLGSSALLRPNDRYVKDVVLNPKHCCSAVAGRLAPGVTREQALVELNLLDRQYRGSAEQEAGIELAGTQFMADPKGDGSFAPMFIGSMLVLFIACANVANLLIARGVARRREIATRLSIGASRGRVVRQLLTESLVLAGAGAALGLLVAGWLPALLVRWIGADPGALQLGPDGRVLAFTLVVSAVAALAFGIAPALHGARASVATALKDKPLESGRVPVRGVLLSIQVALAVVLLVSAAVIANAVRRMWAADFGFSAEGITVVSMEAPARGFDAARTRAVARQIAETLAPRGGIALTSTSPLGSGNIKGAFIVPGTTGEEPNSVYEVSPGYFELLEIPIVAGRPITEADDDRPVIVVNESMAREFWGSAPAAVGRQITSEPGRGGYNRPGLLEIVGVARDVRIASLTSVEHTIYQPLSGRNLPQVLADDPASSRADIKATIARIEPRLQIRFAPLSANLEPRLRGSRTAAMLAGGMGALALALAAIGVFSVFTCWMRQRTHEIGVRIALGARPVQVIRLLLRSSAWSIGAGAAVGIAGAAAASRVLQSYTLGFSAADPLAYAAVLLTVTAAGALATYWPARRATRVDPVHALRCE